MRNVIFLCGMLFASASNASVISVDYEVTSQNGFWGNGTFLGTDNNADNLLTFDEITSFEGSNNIENQQVDLSTLFDVGDFNILTDTWLNNAISWNGYPDNSWFTWNNRQNSVNSTWAVVTTASVPEPGTLILLGLGLAGIGFSRSKKKSI